MGIWKHWANPAGRLAELFTLSYSCPGSHTSSSAGDERSSRGKNRQHDPAKMTLSDNLTVEIHFMYTTVWWPPSPLTCLSDTFWFKFFFFFLLRAGLKCYNVHWSVTHIWTQRQVTANEIRKGEKHAAHVRKESEKCQWETLRAVWALSQSLLLYPLLHAAGRH